MTREDARVLKDLLGKGSLGQALDILREEFSARTGHLLSKNLRDPEELAEAQALQGEIKGGLGALDRLEELIHETSSPE